MAAVALTHKSQVIAHLEAHAILFAALNLIATEKVFVVKFGECLIIFEVLKYYTFFNSDLN